MFSFPLTVPGLIQTWLKEWDSHIQDIQTTKTMKECNISKCPDLYPDF